MIDRLGPRPNLSVIRDDVRAIDAYPVPSAVGFVKLDAMENPFSLPEGLQQQLGERLGRQALNRYPLSDPRGFKERLGKAVGLPTGMQLMLGNGSDELIHLVILACAKPGATVLAPAPSFVMYEMAARFDHCSYVATAEENSPDTTRSAASSSIGPVTRRTNNPPQLLSAPVSKPFCGPPPASSCLTKRTCRLRRTLGCRG